MNKEELELEMLQANIAKAQADTSKVYADIAFVQSQTNAQQIANKDAELQVAARARNEEFANKFVKKYGQGVPGEQRRFNVETIEPMPVPAPVMRGPTGMPVRNPGVPPKKFDPATDIE